METLIGLSDRFGETMANAFSKNVAEDRKLEDTISF